MFNLGIARPCQIIVNFIFKHIYTAGIYTIIVLWEKENFLLSNLEYGLTNAALCPLVTLSSFSLKKMLLLIPSYPFNILNTSIRSPLNLLVSNVVNLHSNRRLS